MGGNDETNHSTLCGSHLVQKSIINLRRERKRAGLPGSIEEDDAIYSGCRVVEECLEAKNKLPSCHLLQCHDECSNILEYRICGTKFSVTF